MAHAVRTSSLGMRRLTRFGVQFEGHLKLLVDFRDNAGCELRFAPGVLSRSAAPGHAVEWDYLVKVALKAASQPVPKLLHAVEVHCDSSPALFWYTKSPPV